MRNMTPSLGSVLVVDDEPFVRDLAALVLRRAGYCVTVAENSTEALEIARAQPDIDLTLIDVVLPGMTGFDLAAELRRITPAMRVAFMSGFKCDHFRQPVAEPCLTKPFTIASLRRVVEQALRI